MGKRRELSVTLVLSGAIIPHLHYGPNSRNWWQTPVYKKNELDKENNSIDTAIFMYPVRLGMKTEFIANNQKFSLQVIKGNSNDSEQPGYISQSEEEISQVANNPTQAVSSLYQKIFGGGTRIAGLGALGFENEEILERLVIDIEFQPFLFSIEKLSVMVYGLGSSSCKELMGAGPRYVSSLLYKYNKKQSIYVQKITNTSCIIEIWYNNEQVNKYEGTTPSEVWKKTDNLKSMNGITLFGLNHTTTQAKLRQLHFPTCKQTQWTDETIMNKIYNYHLKRRTISNIEWQKFFVAWYNYPNNIIELRTSLEKIYPINYKLSERELQAWHTMLRSVGCTNVTPFGRDISQVNN